MSDSGIDAIRADQVARKAARVAKGEECSHCGRYMYSFFGNVAGPRTCNTCNTRTEPEPFESDRELRCPSCLEVWNPSDSEDHQVYEEGEHDVSCQDCEHDFIVSTVVSYDFTSPEAVRGEE